MQIFIKTYYFDVKKSGFNGFISNFKGVFTQDSFGDNDYQFCFPEKVFYLKFKTWGEEVYAVYGLGV